MILILNIIYISIVKKSEQSKMQTQEVVKQNNQIISSMSGFTSDFFGAFETTLTDNSMNNSKCDLSQSNANKSQLIRQIREDSVVKISEFVQKMIKFHVFDQIFIFGVKKKRKQDKTPLNLHKHFYKIQLLFNMKNRSKQQWAFHRLIKFTQQFDIRQIFPSNSLEQNANRNQQNTERQRISNNQSILNLQKNVGNLSSTDIIKQKTYEVVMNSMDNVNAEKLLLALENIFGDSKQICYAFNCMKQYEYYLTKKSYLIQMLIFFRKKQLRFAFLKLNNLERQNNLKKQKSVMKMQQVEDAKDSMPISKPTLIQKKTPEPYGLEDKIKFKKIEKGASKGSILSQNTQTRINGGSQQKGHTKRPKSGLKFNKVNRKKTESPQKKEQRNQNQLTTKTEQKPLQQIKRLKRQGSFTTCAPAKQFKHATSKSIAIQTLLQNQKPLLRLCNFHQFNSIVKSYYFPPHQLKRQVPDEQDQDIEAQRFGLLQQSRLKQSSFSNKQQLFKSSKRLQKLDDKKPLQFSNKKKNRLSNNKSKSKKSLQKSDEQAETVNIQSLKSYYFPEQQHFGKVIATNHQKVQSTKYIGGEKWEGKSKKKRITTEAQIRNVKSNQKNPYMNELREKIVRKASERVISLSKMVERSISGRSNSKTSKTSKEDQKKTEKQQSIITTTQNYKQIIARHASPQQKLCTELTKTPPAQVPRQWYFTNNNPSVMTSPLKSNQSPSYKAILQFQKATSNNRKV